MILEGVPILEQLILEETILRLYGQDWILINYNSPAAIVMGSSSQLGEHVDLHVLTKSPVSLIQRFSGGGSVFIDENTFFLTYIFDKSSNSFCLYPNQIFQWVFLSLRQVFTIPGFDIRENDFVIHDRKVGGNAQYIKKDRWLQHMSFLWDFVPENMTYLRIPSRQPKYRYRRAHLDFLTKLSFYYDCRKEYFIDTFITKLLSMYAINMVHVRDITSTLLKDPRSCLMDAF